MSTTHCLSTCKPLSLDLGYQFKLIPSTGPRTRLMPTLSGLLSGPVRVTASVCVGSSVSTACITLHKLQLGAAVSILQQFLINMAEEEDKIVKSRSSDIDVYVAFVSGTDRKVDIFWVDFNGNPVKYATLSKYREAFPITTFVSHPWTFKDADTQDRLVHNANQDFYFPQLTPNNISVVLVGIPVYTLRTRCLQVVRKLFNESDIPGLEIPRNLKSELLYSEDNSSEVWEGYDDLEGHDFN